MVAPDTRMARIAGISVGVAEPDLAAQWQAAAGIPAATLELIELSTPAGPSLGIPDVGSLHICLRTSDIDTAHARLAARGARFTAAPVRSPTGPPLAYFFDPAGVQFQLLELAAGPLATPEAPPIDEAVGVLHHVGLTLTDLDGAVAWLERALGLATVVRVDAEGSAAGAPLGLPEIRYRAVVLQVGPQFLELMEFESDGPQRAPDGASRLTLSVPAAWRERVTAASPAPDAVDLRFED